MSLDEDLPFKVVRTNAHDEIIARAANLLVGRAAYETAKADVSEGSDRLSPWGEGDRAER